MPTRKIQILGTMLKQAENADTLDGKHADEFAAASDVEVLKSQVGDTPVSEQINIAVANKIDKVPGTTGNAVVFGKDGAIADSGRPAARTYVVPYYNSTSITSAQKTEIVNIVKQIQTDSGSYAVFMEVGTNKIPASVVFTRNTVITATLHDSQSVKYNISVSNAGAVTLSQEVLYIYDIDKLEDNTKAPTGGVVMQYVQDYVEEHGGAVKSVNGQVGKVQLSAADVGALPSDTKIPTKLSELEADKNYRTVTDAEREAWSKKSDFSGKYSDLEGKPTKLSEFDNDVGYITDVPVESVNGKTGVVVLDATDVGALSDDTTALPNPHAITFTGAVTGTYDGSSALEINIPDGGDKAPTDDEALEFVIEMGLVDPIASDDGAIYTDENNMIYTL